ncbi:hypothetical protein KCP77_16610 [Salmonella enterica subsp. enterica]|nr:hypothetical protein KCP77_16610 [Salmonella enterica subsp. enterica]
MQCDNTCANLLSGRHRTNRRCTMSASVSAKAEMMASSAVPVRVRSTLLPVDGGYATSGDVIFGGQPMSKLLLCGKKRVRNGKLGFYLSSFISSAGFLRRGWKA